MSKKDEIIDAASHLFSEKGYELSMSDIAKQVGIKTPSLYSHFESKEEIISIVIENEMTRLYSHLNQTIDGLENESVELKLKSLYLSVFDYFDTSGKLQIMRRLPLLDDSLIKEKCKETIRIQDGIFSSKMKKLMEEGIASGEVRKDATNGVMLLYLATIQGLLDVKLLYRYSAAEMERYSLAAWEAYWNGIKKV